jgi:hypothetical protein
MHLQFGPHDTFAWKHSQYFFKQPDFLQWHPLLCFTPEAMPSVGAIFDRNASGFLSSVASIAA